VLRLDQAGQDCSPGSGWTGINSCMPLHVVLDRGGKGMSAEWPADLTCLDVDQAVGGGCLGGEPVDQALEAADRLVGQNDLPSCRVKTKIIIRADKVTQSAQLLTWISSDIIFIPAANPAQKTALLCCIKTCKTSIKQNFRIPNDIPSRKCRKLPSSVQ
jgi:hypothetical protein